MCGIAGFFETKDARGRGDARAIGGDMLAAITHRGPDGGDIWQDPDLALLLAHRRLSILDISPEGAQPMTSPSGRYVMTYNGEIYNHIEIRKSLDHTFRGTSDTETILAAIEAWGFETALNKINGMFAFALWDRETRALHFARDRMGKKPLYIGWAGDSLVFGSELKSLTAHPDFKPEINNDALTQMIARGYITPPNSIYNGIAHLPAGHYMSLPLEALSAGESLSSHFKSYWNAAHVMEDARDNIFTGSEDEALEAFDKLLGQCVSERLISDVPLGAFLSGGIDSSAVVALMQKFSPTPVKTYSIGFKEAGFNEAEYAKKIAAHLGCDHHEMYVGARDALDIIPKLPDIYDEPFGDISAIPTYLVSHFARQSVTVALSGDGGDEMLGGYARHVEGQRLSKIPPALRKMMGAGIKTLPPALWDKLNPKHPQFGRRMHKAAAMLSHDSCAAMYDRILNTWGDTPVTDGVLGSAFIDHRGLSFAEDMMLSDTLGYLPADILTKVDRASMAVSLEARAPLLDQRIYQFAWRLPLRMKIRNGKGKYLLRELLNRYVPDHLFERPKQGFTMPVGDWLNGELRDWAEDLLDEKSLQHGLLDTGTIRQTWHAHLKGNGNHTQALWHVLMFQAWHRRWMEG
ncbi:MAG: asparagine synthase (glutamine-hydrolyzing) [Alphaproteobacteria bacterium]